MPPRAHAKLAPSASHRWFNCPAAPRLEAEYPDESNPASRLGTAVHDVGERCLTRYKATGGLADACRADRLIGTEVKVEDEVIAIDERMAAGAQTYVDFVVGELKRLGLGVEALVVEQRVSLDHIRKGLGGTADAVIRQPWGELLVIDYKNGYGYVSAVENTQLLIYALGAMWNAQEGDYDPYETVTMAIVQPNTGGGDETPVRAFTMDADELIRWGEETLRPAAKAASSKRAKPAAGDWCRWCKAKAQCSAFLDLNVGNAMTVFSPVDVSRQPATPPPPPETIPADKLGLVLAAAEMISAWVKAVQARVDYLLAAGVLTPEQIGWKRVWGRATHAWKDGAEEAVATKAGDLGVDPYERSLLSVAKLRDSIAAELQAQGTYKTKKAAKERAEQVLADFIDTKRGVSLVPITDKREAILPAINAFTTAGQE